jgi:type I restriction enzyme S subunit
VKSAFAELGSVAEFINGAAFKPDDWGDEGKRIIRIQNLTDSTKPFNRTTRAVADKLHVHPGDLLVSWSASLGVFEWTDSEVALLNQHIFRVVPDKARVEKRYLRHGLEGALVEMQRHLHGATMQHVNRGEFLATKLYLPPLAEQRRIAEVLDRAEALRAKRRAALAQLDSLTQSLFLDLFGDPATNPKGWPIRVIRDLLESASYGTSEKSGATGEFPVLRMNNISRTGEMDFTDLKFMDLEANQHDRYLVRTGDVLFNRTNSVDLVGKTGVYRETKPMAYAGYLIRLRVTKENHPEFLSAFLNSAYSKAMLRGMCKSIIGMANINATEIQAMKIPQPPISLQREFARRVTAVEALKTAQRASLAELDALFATLQHRAFRGEL